MCEICQQKQTKTVGEMRLVCGARFAILGIVNQFDIFTRIAPFISYGPLFFCSVYGMAVTLMKLRELKLSVIIRPDLLDGVRRLLNSGQLSDLGDCARMYHCLSAELIQEMQDFAYTDGRYHEGKVAHIGESYVKRIENGLDSLGVLATLGPLLGLFGTVIGIILVFQKVALMGDLSSPQQLADGIGTALYTTVLGLIVGVFSLLSQKYLQRKADVAIYQLEGLTLEIMIASRSDRAVS